MRRQFVNYVLALGRGKNFLLPCLSYDINPCYFSIVKRNIWKLSCNSRSYSNFSLENPAVLKYLEILIKEYESLTDVNASRDVRRLSRLNQLRPIVDTWKIRQEFCLNLISIQELSESGDKEVKSLAEEESQAYKQKLGELESELLQLLILNDHQDASGGVVMEISAGVGGQEAMLFAKELHNMYIAYANFKGWNVEEAEISLSELGGLRHSNLFISGENTFRNLKHEAGVHRVQRIPSTERSGRIHTSTVSIIVLPQPQEVDVELKDKDLKVETKRSSGAGGQHVNKTESAVRITHIPSGISVECQVDRSQIKNRELALRRLRAKLYQLHLDEQFAKADASRKMQVKSSERSEKIRTYNFNQDRITDHRLSDNMYDLESFFRGGEQLDNLVLQLEIKSCTERFQRKIHEILNEAM